MSPNTGVLLGNLWWNMPRKFCSSVLQYLHTGRMEYSRMGRPEFRNHFSEPKTSVIIDLVKKFALRYGHNEESVNESPESSQELIVDIVNPERIYKSNLLKQLKRQRTPFTHRTWIKIIRVLKQQSLRKKWAFGKRQEQKDPFSQQHIIACCLFHKQASNLSVLFLQLGICATK